MTSLEKIKLLCRNFSYGGNYDKLFAEVMENIEMCYSRCNCYIGVPGYMALSIDYKLASGHSNMQGKTLKRCKGEKNVSFEVLETMSRIYVHSNDVISPPLHHFGPPEKFLYPFLVLPLITHQDCIAGILGVDSIDEGYPISFTESVIPIITVFVLLVHRRQFRRFNGIF